MTNSNAAMLKYSRKQQRDNFVEELDYEQQPRQFYSEKLDWL